MNLTSLTSSKNQLQGKEIARSTRKTLITDRACGLLHLFPVILSILTVRADVMGK